MKPAAGGGVKGWLLPAPRLWAALALLGVALLPAVLIACGDDDDADSSEDAPATGSSPTSAPTATNEAAAAIGALDFPEELADGMALGRPDAAATLQLFEDFQCPFCLSLAVRWEALLLEYVEDGKLRLGSGTSHPRR
jgi:protein-disulfide isomerase